MAINNVKVYVHKRNDTNEIFYVGIGLKNRATEKKHRSEFWHKIVNKVGYSVEIVAKNLPRELAFKIEIALIKEFGKKSLNQGTLVNFTDGGEGITGLKHSLATRTLISQSRTGKGLNNKGAIGFKNHTRKVFNTVTFEVYDSIQDAANFLKMKRTTLNAQLVGQNKNQTNLIYLS